MAVNSPCSELGGRLFGSHSTLFNQTQFFCVWRKYCPCSVMLESKDNPEEVLLSINGHENSPLTLHGP